MKTEKFSIVVPVYNVEKYLEECILSVLAQTFEDYELILVDDGSTDSSGEICDDYAEKYAQIRVFHKPNAGSMHTRSYGISRACGEWYVFLDSDDTLERTALEKINQYTQEADCVIYGYERIQNGKIIAKEHDVALIHTDDKRQIYKKFFIDGSYNALWRKAVKASVVGNRDFSCYYHISMGEDLLQSLEILENSKTWVFIPDILYKYRVNPNGITQSVKYSNYSINHTVQLAVLEFLRKEDVFEEEDYGAYRDFCLDGELFGNLVTIARFNTTRKNKLILYRKFKASKYYIEFLSEGYSKKYRRWKQRVVFRLFQLSYYNTLLLLLKG